MNLEHWVHAYNMHKRSHFLSYPFQYSYDPESMATG